MGKTVRLALRLILVIAPALTPAAQANEAIAAPAQAALAGHAARSGGGGWQPVVAGHLDNGVRFAILPRRGDEPGVGLLMRNEGGFIAERRPGERGLAHLIEHVAFLSPTSAAPDDLHHLPHIGLPLTFPAPSAGTTTWRETNYFLSTRTTRTADLATLLKLFREVAGGLTLRADAVDEGRAQVVAEMAERKLGNDIYASYIGAVAPGSPTDVIDAQNSDDVSTASVDTIRALYHRLYQPENMMVVVVGNVDAAQTKALIKRQFGDWKRVGPAPVRLPIPTFQSDRIAPISFSNLERGRRTAMMTVASPTPAPPPTRSRQAERMLMDMVAVRAVTNRLASAQPHGPPGKVGMFIENGEQGHRLIMLWDNFAADGWQPAIAGLRKTSCELRTAGFSDREWTAAKQDVIEELERATGSMAGVANVELAKDLSHALVAGRDLIPPDALLRRARAWLPTVGRQAGNGWWRRQWHAGVEHIRVEAPELGRIEDPIASIRTIVDGTVDDAGCKVRPQLEAASPDA